MQPVTHSLNVVFPRAGQIELVEEPVAASDPGTVLCQAERSLISIGTELFCLNGRFDPGTNWADWVRYPFHPGYGMVARVLTTGEQVTELHAGDRIAVATSHRQYFAIRPEQGHRVPNDVSDEDATWAALACTTQLGVRRAALQLGESVGVIGLGMLGQLVVQYLWLSGVRRIIAIDPVAHRLALAAAHGATHTLAMNVQDAHAAISHLTGGAMLDVVFDITGHPAVLASAVQLLRRLGRLVLLGDTPVPTQQALGPGVVSNSIAILGIHGSMSPMISTEFNPWTQAAMTDLFFDYLRQGRMDVGALVTARHDPRDAPAVYGGLVQDRSTAIGVMFDWSRLG